MLHLYFAPPKERPEFHHSLTPLLWYKRLEVGGFKIPRVEQGAQSAELRASELAMILDGIDVSKLKQAKLREIEEFAMKRLRDIQGLLGGDVLRAKSELAKHCPDITLTPKGNSYMVSGDWNLLGGLSGGAGGADRT